MPTTSLDMLRYDFSIFQTKSFQLNPLPARLFNSNQLPDSSLTKPSNFLFQRNGICINSRLNNSCNVEYLQEENIFFLHFSFISFSGRFSLHTHRERTEFPVSFHLPEKCVKLFMKRARWLCEYTHSNVRNVLRLKFVAFELDYGWCVCAKRCG